MPARRLLMLIACLGFGTIAHAQSGATGGNYGIERSTGKVICTDDADDRQNSDDPSYARAAAWDRMVLGENNPCNRDLNALDGGTWGESAPFAGTDSAGRAAQFRLYVLHQRFNWLIGSSTGLQDNGQPASFAPIRNSPEFRQRFCSAKAAFSVGTASFEGPTEPNRRLARSRGARVGGALADLRNACPDGPIPILFAINLGENQNDLDCTGEPGCLQRSANQRRLIIVAATDLAIDVDLEQALRSGLSGQQVFSDFSVGDYDLFEVTSL